MTKDYYLVSSAIATLDAVDPSVPRAQLQTSIVRMGLISLDWRFSGKKWIDILWEKKIGTNVLNVLTTQNKFNGHKIK